MRIAVVLLACLIHTASEAGPLSDHFARIELNLTDDRPTSAALVFDQSSDTAWIDAVSISTRLHGAWYARPSEDIEIVLTPRDSKLTYALEQRLVTYLNLLLPEGDAVTIDLDASTYWAALTPMTKTRHRMNTMNAPEIDITLTQLIEIVRRQAPEYVRVAQSCRDLNSPPCELVTDHEVRLHAVQAEQRQLVGMIRLFAR